MRGIYCIRNKINGKRYVGSTSVTFGHRFRQHVYRLRRGISDCRVLQMAWDKYGEDAFEFMVLESVPGGNVLDREQVWMDKLRPEYNVRKRAESNAGLVHSATSKKLMSEKAKLWVRAPDLGTKISRSKKAKKYVLNDAQKAGLKLGWLAASRPKTQSHKDSIAEAFAGDWVVTEPDGTEVEVRNLKKFCRDRKLDQKSMWQVANGQMSHCKGFRCRYSDPEKGKLYVRKRPSFVLVDPTGAEHQVDHLTAFCKEHGLSQGHMSLVASGHRKSHKGWRARRIVPEGDQSLETPPGLFT